MNLITRCLCRHPWIYVVIAFVLLLTAWSTLIMIAVKFAPQSIEVPTISSNSR